MVIDKLTIIKTQSDIIFSLVEVLIDIFWYFLYALSLITNKPQLNSSLRQKLSKISYVNCRKSINTTIKFSSKNYFLIYQYLQRSDNRTMAIKDCKISLNWIKNTILIIILKFGQPKIIIEAKLWNIYILTYGLIDLSHFNK